MNTLCLYEYPAAVRDIKGWVDFMVEHNRLCSMSWEDPLRPVFGINHTPLPEGIRPTQEKVYCIPLADLADGYRPDFAIDKLVIFGALRSYITPHLIAFLNRHSGEWKGQDGSDRGT
jgi:hypothetical protein